MWKIIMYLAKKWPEIVVNRPKTKVVSFLSPQTLILNKISTLLQSKEIGLIPIWSIPFIDTYLIFFLYNRALEIIQDEEYLDESDFDEIKRQKRKINPLTPALINNITSSVKNGNSLSNPKLNLNNQSTVIKDYIESAHHVSIWNETDGKRRLFGKRPRSKRQTEAVTNGK